MTRRDVFAAAWVAMVPSLAKAAAGINPARMKMTASGLRYQDVRVGRGAVPRMGQTVEVLYAGWFWNGKRKGGLFDSSLSRRHPFEFPLGEGEVIAGWDEGISTMRVGGTRLLLIPPDLAYGSEGAGGGVIPPNATLLFQVELLGVK
jgi:peptidylprolyl isomerase